jgi:aminobenzoyl-glutamate transport protein
LHLDEDRYNARSEVDMSKSGARPQQGWLLRVFGRIAEVGNRLPDPLTLFVILTGLVVLASVLAAGASAEVVQRTGEVETRTVASLLTREGIRWMFLSAIDNFINFAPLGPVLTVMIGIGVAERTGFITMGLRVLVGAVPPALITATLVFACVMSSMVADAGYVVLTPLGAVLFAGLGRHPLAGLAAAFAGVSGGYSANLLITGLDPMLARLTQQAAQTIDPGYTVQATSNYYFMVASTVMITVVGTLVTVKIVEPLLGKWDPKDGEGGAPEAEEPTRKEKTAFAIAMGFAGLMAVLIALLAILPSSPLRDEIAAGDPAVNKLHSFFESIEVLISVLFIVPAVIYGVLTKKVRNDKDVARMAGDAMASMGPYIVLAFVAGQFVAYFNHTNLGSVTAVKGADLLHSIGLQGAPLLIAFLIVSAMMNLFVGSASAKWAFMAPIFVPMLMMMGFSPEAVQAAYRVGDSVTNIITPLMPYLPIIIVFARKYDRKAGLGTIISAMLPYSIAFFVAWTILLLGWVILGIPLGPGAPSTYTPAG